MPYTPAPNQEIVSTIRRETFYASETVSTMAQLARLVDLVRLQQITPLELDITYGVPNPGATAMRSEYYIMLADVDNLPLVGGARDRAIWSAAVYYAFTGTAYGAITSQRENADFFNPASFTSFETADWSKRMALVLLGSCSTAKETRAQGVLTYRVDYIQRVWGGDNCTFEKDNGDWEDFASDEESDDSDSGGMH